MTFALQLAHRPEQRYGKPWLEGLIAIGDFSETFWSPIQYWTRDQYVQQWRGALERVCVDGLPACLIVNIAPPRARRAADTWMLYPRPKRRVAVQNRWLLPDTWKGQFDEANPDRYIHDYTPVSEDGQRISTWFAGFEDLQNCLGDLRRQSEADCSPN